MLLCAVICALLALCAIAPAIIRGGGTFTLREDFNSQQIPFAMAENRAIHAGGTWVWNLDLGASLIRGFSYYHLGSPFYWITLPFPPEAFPYLTGWILILKYAVAGAAACHYMKRHVTDWRLACVGAVLYAFSGYQCANLFFYNFHDVVALFPFLLAGLDTAVCERRYRPFILAVFFNCLLNYFFFIQEVLFLVLYYLVLYWGKDVRRFLRDGGKIACCGLLGGGMAAVLFLPSILYVVGNPRVGERSLRLFFDLPRLLLVIKGFLLPADPMHDNAAALLGAWDSTACWLPLVGLVLPLAYVIRKRDRLSILLLILVVISLLPILNAAFMLYTVDIYTRWWFMLDLLLALASVRVLSDPGAYPVIGAGIAYAATILLFTASLFFLRAGDGSSLVFHAGRLAVYSLIALAGAVSVMGLLTYADKTGRKKQAAAVFAVLLSVTCVATTAMIIRLYQRDAGTEWYLKDLARGASLRVIDPQYRYRESANVFTLPGEGAGLSAFSSTVTNSVIELDGLFDYEHMSKRMDKDSIPGLAELLGGRYVLRDDGSVGEADACPIGFAASGRITSEELKKLDREDRGVALLAAILVPDGEETLTPDVRSLLNSLPEISEDAIRDSVQREGRENLVKRLVAENSERAVSDFSRDGWGFTCTTEADTARIYLFSVPWDAGWHATIDGVRIEPVRSAGMMLLPVEAGKYRIVFRYRTPGAVTGFVISLCAWGVFLGFGRYEGKHHPEGNRTDRRSLFRIFLND